MLLTHPAANQTHQQDQIDLGLVQPKAANLVHPVQNLKEVQKTGLLVLEVGPGDPVQGQAAPGLDPVVPSPVQPALSLGLKVLSLDLRALNLAHRVPNRDHRVLNPDHQVNLDHRVQNLVHKALNLRELKVAPGLNLQVEVPKVGRLDQEVGRQDLKVLR